MLRLKLGVGVGADFAVQANFFVLRGCPFHRACSFRARQSCGWEEISTAICGTEQGNEARAGALTHARSLYAYEEEAKLVAHLDAQFVSGIFTAFHNFFTNAANLT